MLPRIWSGAPAFIRSDNGPEFIARDLGIWLQGQNIGTRFIEPGKPWQNGFAESFHSRLQEECLNLEVLYSVLHAQVVLESWRTLDNTGRPHSSLGYQTPDEWAREAGGRDDGRVCGVLPAHGDGRPTTG
nr:integrase core domain-containing protein [Deinococcus sp. 12RED42]